MTSRFSGQRKGQFAVLAILALVLAVMTGSWRGEPGEAGPLEEAVMTVSGPLLAASSSSAGFLQGLGDFLLGWKGLREENRGLRREVARLSRELERRREEELAFQRLASMLEYRLNTGLAMRTAAVIGRDATNLFRTVLINKGSLDGLGKDMAVVTPEGVVGKTIRVHDRTSRVLLLTDRSSGIDALVQRTRDQGVIQGGGESSCEMQYLPRQAGVAVGDVIVTSGMGGVFPKGIRLGQVTKVTRGGYLLQNVEVRPTAPLDRLEEVMVIIPKPEGP